MNTVALSQIIQNRSNTKDLPHVPVMEEEVLKLLSEIRPRSVADGTCGAGGHAHTLLENVSSIERYFCIDWDKNALSIARKRLSLYKNRVEFVHSNFRHIPQLIPAYGISKLDAILLDLGLSTMHLMSSGRGFSFTKDEPLDMRMDDSEPTTALDLINNLSEAQLAALIREYGEEKWAKKIAGVVKDYCEQTPIPTSRGLAEAIKRAIPRRFHPKRIHPATRTFQALRIALNRELDNLKVALHDFPNILNDGGRFLVISFHSLEDRLVKHSFKNDPRLRPITKRPLRPTSQEITVNPKARSAKLRCAERISAEEVDNV